MRKVWFAFLASFVALAISLGVMSTQAGASSFTGGGGGGGLGSVAARIGASMSMTASQSVPSNTGSYTLLNTNWTQSWAHGGATTTPTGSITVPVDGTYLVSAMVYQEFSDVDATNLRGGLVVVNGVGRVSWANGCSSSSNGGNKGPSRTEALDLVAGDVLTLKAFQDSGANRPLLGSLSAVLVGGGPASFAGGTISSALGWDNTNTYTTSAAELQGPSASPMVVRSGAAQDLNLVAQSNTITVNGHLYSTNAGGAIGSNAHPWDNAYITHELFWQLDGVVTFHELGLGHSVGADGKYYLNPYDYTASDAATFGIKQVSGAGSPSGLGALCPAATPTTPYTWLKFYSSDGSVVYVPAWK
jgi:hypothetical protein